MSGLRRTGFTGSDEQVIEKAARQDMPLLVASCSASSMWVANAATVSPSADTADGRVHFTAANLNCKYHRSIEHPTTTRVLGAMFADATHFDHHPALPAVAQFGDEGAANHTRFCRDYGEAGVEFSCLVAVRSTPAIRHRRSIRPVRPRRRHARLRGCTV